ncbi:MAG: hypothetical protein J6P03_02170 [Opitutales bacterium]|nr:hypothetical protein [Opitutales bacterium]
MRKVIELIIRLFSPIKDEDRIPCYVSQTQRGGFKVCFHEKNIRIEVGEFATYADAVRSAEIYDVLKVFPLEQYQKIRRMQKYHAKN